MGNLLALPYSGQALVGIEQYDGPFSSKSLPTSLKTSNNKPFYWGLAYGTTVFHTLHI